MSALEYCSWSNPACDHMPGGRFNLEFFRWKVFVRDSLTPSFLLQIGLMYRQIGPIIISMSYMIMDVFVFLFIFVIVYISFTLCTVYIYGVYDEDRQIRFLNLSLTYDYSASFTWSDDLIQTWFNDIKSASEDFKLSETNADHLIQLSQPGRCSSTITRLRSSYSIGHSLGGRRFNFKGSIVKIILFTGQGILTFQTSDHTTQLCTFTTQLALTAT